MDRTIRFSVSLPEDLLNDLDEKVISRGYSSRSEFIRDLIREKIVEEKWESDKEVIGVLVIVYDHHRRELAQKMIDIQHNHLVNILCTTHIHIDRHNCLETIIIKGRPSEIEKIGLDIGGMKGVKYSRLTRTANIEK